MLHFNMKLNKINLVPIFIILLSFAFGFYFYFYPQMPSQIASHWGINGEVDGYMSKFWGLFLMPILSVFLYFLFLFLPKTDPYKKNFKEFKKYYEFFVVIIISFLFYIYLLTIFWNLGFRFNMIQFISPGIAFIFYFAGTLMSKTKQNWFVGIRTPWTLSNEKVWVKTHQLGAQLFKACAFISLFSLVLPNQSIFFIIFPIIFSSIFLFIYSYWEYKKLTNKKNA